MKLATGRRLAPLRAGERLAYARSVTHDSEVILAQHQSRSTAMDADITEIEAAVRRLPAAERVRLIEVIARSLRESEAEPRPDKAALEDLLDEMSELPSQSPLDG